MIWVIVYLVISFILAVIVAIGNGGRYFLHTLLLWPVATISFIRIYFK